ncbi:MAG: EAL domain-containing protein [Nitrospirae bacterium]|nr:EAL domain-containing protein [Nitrospirota bacterium]
MGIPLRVLIVEDSEDDKELVLRELRRGGYDPVHERVDTSEAMGMALDQQTWDIIISDYSMPNFNARAALEVLKARALDIPFIIVSGTIGEETAVAAMKAGANDYLMKGNLARLVPAIERELRDAEVRRGREKAEEAFKASESKFRNIAENALVGIYQSNLRGDILYANNALARIYEFESPEEMKSKGAVPRYKNLKDRDALIEDLKETGKVSNLELETLTKRGETRNVLASATLDGEILSGMVIDITARKQAEEMAHHLAYYDILTDLPNRILLYDRIQQAIIIGKRENRSLSLLIMDLDRFKEINSTVGHYNGDLLLQQVGLRLRDLLREADTVARLGGDEFAILLLKSDAESATGVAGKIMARLEEPFLLSGLSIDVSASIGIALFPGHGENAVTLIQHADTAMYKAKETEGGVAIYSPKYDRYSPERLVLMGELRHAIDAGQLFLLYQPKIDLKSGKTIGVEALVRWQHPTHGVIPPDQFIALAEHTGSIKQLTLWVLKEALRQSRSWHQAGVEVSVAVNLSVRSLQSPQILEQIKGLLSTWGVASSSLRLEITESIIMADPALAMEVIKQLTAMGICFSIDDFGTGYSSLSYLQRLPVDEIKIDKSFVMNMVADENSAAIVGSIIELAHILGLKVVAEGVENKDILDRLALAGCDAAQGYLISKPMPQDDLAVWLENQVREIGGY